MVPRGVVCEKFEFRNHCDRKILIAGHSRSFIMIPFDIMRMVFRRYSAATLCRIRAIIETIAMSVYCDVESHVVGRSTLRE